MTAIGAMGVLSKSSSLTVIPADITGGDAHALYFAWLLNVQSGEIDVTSSSRLGPMVSVTPQLWQHLSGIRTSLNCVNILRALALSFGRVPASLICPKKSVEIRTRNCLRCERLAS